jgi:hypothetical protein
VLLRPATIALLQRSHGNQAVGRLAGFTGGGWHHLGGISGAVQRHCDGLGAAALDGSAGRAILTQSNATKIAAQVRAHWAALEAGAVPAGGGGAHGAGGANATLATAAHGNFVGKTDSSHHAEALAIHAALRGGAALAGAQMQCNMDCCYMCTVLCAALGITIPAKDGKTYPTYFIPPDIWTNAATRQAFIGANAELMYQHLSSSAQSTFRSGAVGAVLYKTSF